VSEVTGASPAQNQRAAFIIHAATHWVQRALKNDLSNCHFRTNKKWPDN